MKLSAKGFTVIVITHEPDVAAYAERVLRFRDGELREDVRQSARRASGEDSKS